MAKQMKVFYDFEFIEHFKGFIEPISTGLVREDGKELYMVFNDFDTLTVARNTWLMNNVMTSIEHEEFTSHVTGLGTPVKDLRITDPNVVSKTEARAKLFEFTDDIWPDFWAWYSSYDHVCLAGLFGRMIDLPKRMPMMTSDIKQLHKQKGSPDMPQQPEGLHNALEDARFNIVRYNYLIDLPDAKMKKVKL